ncbi:MsnO8 family LLM class oxidoreductase [Actinoplanes sp. NPDC089786]|uniref:MsnO8 family LLM class oxidoreductase n=1 Tax=Actinoplanes sp. NPDC089786 TaxID=3155185 RepID=UPI0034280118
MSVALSVLDQSPVAHDRDTARAVRDTVRLARAVDDLGYRRFWVAEHHNSATFAGAAPVVLAATLLENTKQMRIGTGGVLLPRHDPAHVAETFHLLADLHPGRVDLGIGRAGGPAATFPAKVDLLRRTLAQLRAGRSSGSGPALWLLGSGTVAAELAGEQGIDYCFGHFLSPAAAGPALAAYTARSVRRPTLAVRVFVSPNGRRAGVLAADYLLWRARKDLGANEPLPCEGEADRHPWTAAERIHAAHDAGAIVVGDPAEVGVRLTELAAAHGVEEVVVNTLAPDLADRIRTYELLVEAMP